MHGGEGFLEAGGIFAVAVGEGAEVCNVGPNVIVDATVGVDDTLSLEDCIVALVVGCRASLVAARATGSSGWCRVVVEGNGRGAAAARSGW
jgi:hypothetical protein